MSRDYPAHPLPAVLAVLARDGKLLAVQRAAEAPPRKWGFPGGMMELGEDPAQAALRELAEETGIQAEAGPVMDAFSVVEHDTQGRVRRHFLLVAVACRWLAGEPAAASDAVAARWLTPGEISELPCHPRMAALAQARLLIL